ncbi:SLAM family member 5 [Camelus dromedarius]|uniref:SLAM family member 5 n=1 Tax=Camelus dromedarius TaxID=9838 RepID=A0A5N4CPT1_CAMDR|nr:SLAM family member 5 [Camelus dromedarius]
MKKSNGCNFLFMSLDMEAAGSDTDILMLNGILGESVTFPLNIQESQEVTSIAWNSKTSVAFVVPGNSGAEPTVSITHQNYHERINVSGQNYNLELRNLRMEDSGIYKADINTKTPEKFTTTTRCYNLQVYHIALGLHARRTGLLSGLAVLALLIIILSSVLLFLLCKRRQDAASKRTVYAYITASRDTQRAESRIYDEIPPSKSEKPSTQDSKPPGTSSYEIVI